MLFTANIYFRIQSGNHMPLVLHVFKLLEASQTKPRVTKYVVTKWFGEFSLVVGASIHESYGLDLKIF